MKPLLPLLCTLLFFFGLRAQQITSFEDEITTLKKQVSYLNAESSRLKQRTVNLEHMLDSVGTRLSRLSDRDSSLLQKQGELEKSKHESDVKITGLGQDLDIASKNWLWGALALACISALLFWWLRRRIHTGERSVKSKIDATAQSISDTWKTLESETVKLDTKLSEILEVQMKLAQAQGKNSGESSEEPDHSLALKVADEILRINKNLSNMDPATKGLKQLAASIKRIEDNFAANGYEMPNLLGQAFNTGMKVIVANSLPDENLKPGEEIITRIIKPQVNFQGVMIQAAQVEVSVGQ